MAKLTELIGVADNLGEPEPVLNNKNSILAITITFQLVAWICVFFRLYTRLFIIRMPWWDDLFVVVSALSTTMGAVAICVMTGTGMGKHLVLLSADQVSDYLRAFWIANATYPCSAALIKLALLFQYLRIFERGAKMWFLSLGLIVFTSLWGLAFGILAWFPTIPVDGYWYMTKPAARYAYGSDEAEAFVTTYEAHAALNMLLDAVVLAVAVPLFFKSNMRKKSYWGLLALFILGGVVNMLSIWRLQSIVETRATTIPTFDPTWYGPTPIVLSTMELSLSSICASLPVFWPVLKKSLGPYIIVTHEIKVTRESRKPNEHGDNVELRRGTPTPASPLSRTNTMRLAPLTEGKADDSSTYHQRNSFTTTQKIEQEEFGRITSFRAECKSGKGSVVRERDDLVITRTQYRNHEGAFV